MTEMLGFAGSVRSTFSVRWETKLSTPFAGVGCGEYELADACVEGFFASFDVATLIFLWLTRMPRCAMSALSTFRTVCLGVTSSVVRM